MYVDNKFMGCSNRNDGIKFFKKDRLDKQKDKGG